MGYALVGSRGAVSRGTAGSAVTPAWGASESRTANNLLVCQVAVEGSATLPAQPTGWSTAIQRAGTSCSASIFYKVAAGGDAAPTIAAITSGVIEAQLDEWSGGATSGPLNQTGSASGTSSPEVCACTAADIAAGQLVIGAYALLYSTAATKTFTNTVNNGMTATVQNDATTSTVDHYNFWDGITTGNSVADQDSLAFTTTKISGVASVIASFKLAPTPVTVTPGVLNLTTTGFAPTVKVGLTVKPTTAALTTATFAPTVKTPQKVTPGVLNATLNAFAPTVTMGVKVQPAPATLTTSGFAPSVLTPRLVSPGLEAASLTGFAPTVGIGVKVAPAQSALGLTTYAPTVTATGSDTSMYGFEPRLIHELQSRAQSRLERKSLAALYTAGVISESEYIALLK